MMKTSALRKSIKDFFFRDSKISDFNVVDDDRIKNKSKTNIYAKNIKPKKTYKASVKIHAR